MSIEAVAARPVSRRSGVVPLWTVEDVAAYLGIPVQTLYQWRRKSFGPVGRRVGKHLRYDPADVREWFQSRSG